MRIRATAAVFVVVVGVFAISAAAAFGNTITPMCTTDQAGTQPCQAGWYTSSVVLSWAWTPGGSGSCPENSYNSDDVQTVSCTVSWQQSTLTATYTIQLETSSPAASAVPARPPDLNGWYNHPVGVAFQGSSFSGIASCTSGTYSGPGSATASVAGTCTDNAGKTAGASFGLQYDAAPPPLAVAADPADRSVTLDWQTSGDVAPLASVEVVRKPGMTDAGASTVYRGDSGAYDDTRVRDGVRYTYTVTAVDQAGNASVRTVTVTPGPRLRPGSRHRPC